MSAINKIHDAAKNAKGKVLDEPVFLSIDLSLHILADDNIIKNGQIDIPVKKIVALGRRDFWEQGQSWRDITQQLHGTDWPDGVFKYFESEIRNESFPAPLSLGELKLICTGGVCHCANGNHRIVAAKSWLALKHGDNAQLKKVNVSYKPINKELIKLLKKAQKYKSDILVSTLEPEDRSKTTVNSKEVDTLFSFKNSPNETYAWTYDEVVLITFDKTVWQRFLPCLFKPWHKKLNWNTIPLQIVENLLDNEWIEEALS